MALVRVYCGLASADRTPPTADADRWLTAAVVDDAGRLLDVCEIGDTPAGYARLCTVLAERSGGPAVAIAADTDDHTLTTLLTAAGRALAIADDDTVEDYAERFADDEPTDEMDFPPAERRAVGLARALQAGVLSAVSLPAPRGLAGLKGVLVAHSALITGRHSAAVALREVLRELHPAALRAYPDPAEPVPLAVLDALPEPHSLNASSSGRARESSVTDVVVTDLANAKVADAATIRDAITALRVAIAETPRRAQVSKVPNTAIAEIIRQAVAAVRACDAACDGLVATLSERLSVPAPARSPATAARPVTRSASTSAPLARAGRRSSVSAPPAPRLTAKPPAASQSVSTPPMAQSVSTPPMAQPVSPAMAQPPVAPAAPAATGSLPGYAAPDAAPVSPPAWVTGTGSNRPVSVPPPSAAPTSPGQRRSLPPAEAGQPFRPTLTTAAMNSARVERAAELRQAVASSIESRSESLRTVRRRTIGSPADLKPGSGPPAFPGREDVTDAVEGRSGAHTGARTGWRDEERGDDDRWIDQTAAPAARYGATDYAVPVPLPRPQSPAPGSRGNWPLVSTDDDCDAEYAGPAVSPGPAYPPADLSSELDDSAGTADPIGTLAGASRVTPPWQADDLPPEPPSLRLVEPPPLADRALREDWPSRGSTGEQPAVGMSTDLRAEPPSLRLVGAGSGVGTPADRDDSGWTGARDSAAGGRRQQRRSAPAESPVADESDGDLLIFAQAKSAWFVGQEEEPDWTSIADFGWQTAAERTARPAAGPETTAGLPRRVPQANLLPGSPLNSDDRQLRIVRDAATIAAHTSGYFRGWRRGQEINGYAVGGRPGRESAGGWDFSRDSGGRDDDEYNYRSARG